MLNLARFSLGELGAKNLTTDFDFQLIARGLGKLGQTFILSRADADAYPSDRTRCTHRPPACHALAPGLNMTPP